MTISPFLWFDDQAEQAAQRYVEIFPNSRVTSVSRYPEGAPQPAGTALTVDFVLDGCSGRLPAFRMALDEGRSRL